MRLFPDKDFLVNFCEQRKEELDTIIEYYEKIPTQNSAWEVIIAYFGIDSLYDSLTKEYGYQEGLPSDDEQLFMLEELYELVLDQDRDGDFFEPFEYDEDLDEIQHLDEETLVSLLPIDEDDIIQACSTHAYEYEVSSLPLDEDV
jgi:hypothetical protein